MMDCWKDNPDDRPTFTQLLSIMEEMMTLDTPYFDLSKTDESESCYGEVAASTSRTTELAVCNKTAELAGISNTLDMASTSKNQKTP